MSIFGLHTQGEVDLLVLRAIRAGAESMEAGSKEKKQVIQFNPYPVSAAKEAFMGISDLPPRERALRAVTLVREISEHYHSQALPLLKELSLLHDLHPEKVASELESIKTEIADLRRRLCGRDTK